MDFQIPMKQVQFVEESIRRAKEDYGVEISRWSGGYGWYSSGGDAATDLNLVFIDGDYAVHIFADPYGRGSLSVAGVDWIHGDKDEECGCDFCLIQREDEA